MLRECTLKTYETVALTWKIEGGPVEEEPKCNLRASLEIGVYDFKKTSFTCYRTNKEPSASIKENLANLRGEIKYTTKFN